MATTVLQVATIVSPAVISLLRCREVGRYFTRAVFKPSRPEKEISVLAEMSELACPMLVVLKKRAAMIQNPKPRAA